MHEYDELVHQEEIICQCHELWHDNLRRLTNCTNGARIRLTNTCINLQLQAALHQPISTKQLRGGHLDSSNAEDGCTTSAKINISYSILFNLTTSYSSYFGGKKGISRNKTSF